MANNVVTLDVDWASKSGMADTTIGFGETFDLVINGVDTLFSTLRLVLLSQSVSDETAILWTFLPETYEWTEDQVTIRNVRIYTQQVLDMLKSQGGKAKLYLSVASQSEDAHFVDYGVSKVTLTIGSYLGDQPIPPSTEISGITIGELKGYVEQMLGQIRALDQGVKEAVSAANASAERAKGYADEANGVREVAEKASEDAEAAKIKADVAEQVAKGAQYAKVFATEAEMKTWAAAEMAKAEDQREVKVGDNLYIKDTGVPDYWWSGEGIGYAQLETGAVRIEVDTALDANSTNPVQNKAVYDKAMELQQAIVEEGSRASAMEMALNQRISSEVASVNAKIDDKQDRLFDAAKRVNNLGGADPDNENECATLENIGGVTAFVGKVKDFGIRGEEIKLRKMTIFRRSGTTNNNNIALQLKVCCWIDGQWKVVFYSTEGKRHGDATRNGQRIEYAMAPTTPGLVLSENERILIIFNDDVLIGSTMVYQIGCKCVPKSGVYALTQTSIPTTENPTGFYQYALALDVEYDCKVTVDALIEGKQDKLTAGENITISDEGVISASGDGGGTSFEYADMFAATWIDSGNEKVPAEVCSCLKTGQTVIGYGAYSDGEGNIVLGQRSTANGGDNIIIGNYVNLYCNGRVYIGTHADAIGTNLINHIDNYSGSDFSKDNGAIMLTACNASVFFATDACGATVIGGTMRDGCYSAKALEDIFNSSGGGGGSSSALIEGVNVDGNKNGAASAYCGNGLLAIGYCSGANFNSSIVVGHSSVAPFKNSIVFGHSVHKGKDGSLAEYLYCKSGINTESNGAVIFDTNPGQSEAARAFFAADGYGNTLIGGVVGYDDTTCLKQYGYVSIADLKALVDEGGGSGGGYSYIKASTSGSPYDIPGCSSGIAIGPNACIVSDVMNGLAIGIGVEATRLTPVRIGSGCASITVNSNYELCVGGKLVGGGGGSSNDSICVYDSVGYCAIGIGSNYVAIGDKSIANTNAVAVGVGAYAGEGEVAIGMGAGNGAAANGFITENSLSNVRRFRACQNGSLGNELFFATRDGKAVLGGEFGVTTNELGTTVSSLCYFYLQDVADMLANGGGCGGNGIKVGIVESGMSEGAGLSRFDEDGNIVENFFFNAAKRTLYATSDGVQKTWGQFVFSSDIENAAYTDVQYYADENDDPYIKAFLGKGDVTNPQTGILVDVSKTNIAWGGYVGLKTYKETSLIGSTTIPTMPIFEALEARVAALETQLAAATALLESNSCVSGVEPIASENGTEVNYSQNPTGLLDGDELL